MQAQGLNLGNILLLLVALAATVASVPTSVLVQNSELASNANLNNRNNNNVPNAMSKVKRSPNYAKQSNNVAATAAATSAPAVGLDKKSSPEVVPATFNAPPPQPAKSASQIPVSSLPTNGEIINSAIAAGLTAAAVEAASAASQRDLEQQQQQAQLYGDDFYGGRSEEAPAAVLHKRGISAQQYGIYGNGVGLGGVNNYGYSGADYYNSPYLSSSASVAVPNGVWADEMDPSIVYTDLQDLDDYVPAQRAPAAYRSKAYDNLQNLLNSEAYLEPVVLPLQYSNRYYGAVDADRNKRSNLNKYNKYATDMRLKRDTKLTPADMLALVALVEAGERARKDTDADAGYMYPAAESYNSPKSYYPTSYDYPTAAVDEADYNGAGAWLEPAVMDYYGVPVNVEAMPKYEMAREHKYGGGSGNGNRYNSKRYMVAKKKRSLGKFLNEPVAKPSISYNNYNNGEKYF